MRSRRPPRTRGSRRRRASRSRRAAASLPRRTALPRRSVRGRTGRPRRRRRPGPGGCRRGARPAGARVGGRGRRGADSSWHPRPRRRGRRTSSRRSRRATVPPPPEPCKELRARPGATPRRRGALGECEAGCPTGERRTHGWRLRRCAGSSRSPLRVPAGTRLRAIAAPCLVAAVPGGNAAHRPDIGTQGAFVAGGYGRNRGRRIAPTSAARRLRASVRGGLLGYCCSRITQCGKDRALVQGQHDELRRRPAQERAEQQELLGVLGRERTARRPSRLPAPLGSRARRRRPAAARARRPPGRRRRRPPGRSPRPSRA